MSKNKINNVFIAEKMGWEYRKELGWLTPTGQILDHELLFDSDWNWIMKCVEYVSDKVRWSLNGTIEYLSSSQDRDGLYSKEDFYASILEWFKTHS